MRDIIHATIEENHFLKCATYSIARNGEGLTPCLSISIPDGLLNYWAYIDFKKPNGETFKTPRIDVNEGKIIYNIPCVVLDADGVLEVQVVFQNADGEIWKTYVKEFAVRYSINAVDDIPDKQDFITEAQKILDAFKNNILDYLAYTVENNEVTITGCSTDCSGVVVIPETIEGYPVTTIGNCAFYDVGDASNITGMIIPESVTKIEPSAFGFCDFTTIKLPNGITDIANSTFYCCEKLKTIEIPNGVTRIGNGAFEQCSSLTDIFIPDSVTSLGSSIFTRSYALKNVYYGGTQEQWSGLIADVDLKMTSNATVYFNCSFPAINKYVVSKIGDIETALDNIIAIQNELIGGES